MQSAQVLKAKHSYVLYVKQSRLCCHYALRLRDKGVRFITPPRHPSHSCSTMSCTSCVFATEKCPVSVLDTRIVTADDLTSSYPGGPGCHCDGTKSCIPVFTMFLGLPDLAPDPLVRGMDPDPDPSIINQK